MVSAVGLLENLIQPIVIFFPLLPVTTDLRQSINLLCKSWVNSDPHCPCPPRQSQFEIGIGNGNSSIVGIIKVLSLLGKVLLGIGFSWLK